MRRFSANYIYTPNGPPLKNGIVEIDSNGSIKNVIDTKGKLEESRNLEFYNGVITPGFVNSHCHLELSGLKGLISKKEGLPKFIEEIILARRKENRLKNEKIGYYDTAMKQQGIVAVGDISNSVASIPVKNSSSIYYHTFIESIGLKKNADEIFLQGKLMQQQFSDNNLISSIVPHAPYSVSRELFLLIREYAEANNSVISIHNQESDAENMMFESGSGKLIDTFKKSGIELGTFKVTGKNSIASIISWLPKENNIIFVHNTYSTKEDIDLVNQNFKNAYWCLCPLSNLNLENRLPDINLFKSLSNVVLGTDSLASNDTLSILDEMKVIVKNYPEIEFQKILEWATINGAKALKIEDELGSIEVDKSPGLNLITNFDFEKMQITEKSEIKALV